MAFIVQVLYASFLFSALIYLCNGEKLRYQSRTKFKDCSEIWKHSDERSPGEYSIYPDGRTEIKVHCSKSPDNSYAVIQRRMNGQYTFNRGWFDYKRGFGDPQGDYWIGLDSLSHLTSIGYTRMRVDMQDWAGNSRYALYTYFNVFNESYSYYLHVGGHSGTVPDDMSFHNNQYFATPDRPDRNMCAVHQKAGWWFNYCAYAMPNGLYYHYGPYTPTGGYYDGIYWKDWLGYGYSLKFVTMTVYTPTEAKQPLNSTLYKSPY